MFATKRQFNAVLKKEGITLTDYYDEDTTYLVFFRKNNRGTNPQGKLRFYYSQDTAISIGTIFVLKGIPYLVISQDGIESDIYYTSMAVKCDTTFNVWSNTVGAYVKVPCAVISDKYTLSHNSTISMISGSVTVYTGDNSYARDMSINSNYYNFGGYYRVGNFFYNNGLAYVYMTREAMPTDDNHSLVYNGITSIDMTDITSYQLSYSATLNGEDISEPTLTYVSSNNNVATVDENGLMTIHSTGTVTITAIWTDGNDAECKSVFTITNGEDGGSGEDSGSETPTPTPNATMAFTSSQTTVNCGFERTIEVGYTDASGNDVTDKFDTVFTITDATFDTSLLEVTDKGNKVVFYYEDLDLYGETFTLNAVDSGNTCTPISRVMTLDSVL